MRLAHIPVAEYTGYAKQFDPEKFDAKAVVKLAKDAGMKYIVMIAKHHEGFAMWPTKVSDFSLAGMTPFKRDPIAEMTAACHDAGMHFGVYYSQNLDWHNPGGGTAGKKWDDAQTGDKDDYIDKIAIPQLRELLTHYGPYPEILWYDIPNGMTRAQAGRIYDAVHALRPDLITNNRLGPGFPGDTETPEQFVPATGYPGRDWEVCMTMNDTWGYKTADHHWKSTAQSIVELVDIVSKGGNFLLNIGPESDCTVPQESVSRLEEIGTWMKLNGDSIYETRASPFRRLAADLRCTQKSGKLFIHVLGNDKNAQIVLPIRSAVTSAALLAKPDVVLSTKQTGAGLEITLPTQWPDDTDSVIVLTVRDVLQTFEPPISSSDDGVLRLTAVDADRHGPHLVPSGAAGTREDIRWRSTDDYYDWPVNIKAPGTYQVSITYAVSEKNAGATVAVITGDESLKGDIVATSPDGQKFNTVVLGKLVINTAGSTTIALRGIQVPHSEVLTLRSLDLSPQ